MQEIFNIMLVCILVVKCKNYLLFLIQDQDGHGFQALTVLEHNVQKVVSIIKFLNILNHQAIQKRLIMVSGI